MAATSLYERLGGEAGVAALTEAFYRRVFADPLLAGLFADPSAPHAQRLAWWFAELFGGPPVHTERRGGVPVMRASHHRLRITESQRRRWVALMGAAAAEVGLDADVRRDLAPYLDVGSTLAMRVSHPGRDG